VLGADSGRNPP